MELEKEQNEKSIEINGSIADRIHLFSDVHGSLPEEYVPEWKRKFIVQVRDSRTREWARNGHMKICGDL